MFEKSLGYSISLLFIEDQDPCTMCHKFLSIHNLVKSHKWDHGQAMVYCRKCAKASNKQIYEPEWKAEGRLHRATRLAVKRPG